MISLCMIVRSPSEELRGLIRVFDPMVEEIIIVFTTPGKETEVMRDLKTHARCRCLYHPLYDDFSEVRNIAIQNATQPWIFVIDDDEWIEPCDLVHLKRFACSGDADAYCFVRYDYYMPGGWGIKLPCRLFRNIPSIHYEGPIYEEIIPSLHPREHRIKIIWDQCPIYHRVDNIADHEFQAKCRFYREILTGHMMKNSIGPRRPGVMFWQMAMLWADSNDFDQSLYYFQKSLEHVPTHSQTLHRMYYDLAGVRWAIGQEEAALSILEKLPHAPEPDPLLPYITQYMTLKLHNRMGLIYSRRGDYEKAAIHFEIARKTNIPSAAIEANMGVVFALSGSPKKASDCFDTATRLNPWMKTNYGKSSHVWTHRLLTDTRLSQII